MAACQVYRSEDKIEKVLATNEQPSILYKDLVKYVQDKGAAKVIASTPYIQSALAEGKLLNDSVEEIALGLWSIAYSDDYMKMFKGMVGLGLPFADVNGEPKFSSFNSTVLTGGNFKKGEPSYVLDVATAKIVNKAISRGNILQQRIAEALMISPDNPVILEPIEHVYHDVDGNPYTSTTTAIKGKLHDPNNLYGINREYGQAFDKILEGIITRTPWTELQKDPLLAVLSETQQKEAFNVLQAYITGLTADGSIVIPQVILGDPGSRIAGAMDVLVIKPNGKLKIIDLKVSKNSINDDAYRNNPYPVSEGSLLEGSLTTKQQHGIQVAVYKKLAELQGFEVEATESVHINLKLDANKAITEFIFEGIESHSPSQNAAFVNKIIPTKISSAFKYNELREKLGINNPVDNDDFLSEEEALPEEELEGDMFDKLYNRVEKIVDALEVRKGYFEKLKDSISFRPKQVTVDKINELIIMLGSDLEQDKPSLAYGRFLNYTKDELNKIIDFVINDANKDRKEYASVLIEADKFLESYRGLIKYQGFGSKDQQILMGTVLDTLDDAKDTIDRALQEHTQRLYQKYSNEPLTKEQLDSILQEVNDISSEDYYLGDIATSTDPLLATIDKIVKNGVQTALDKTDTAIDNIKSLGRSLLSSLGISKPKSDTYDFMKVFNAAGKWTGRYVTRVGQQYWEKYYELRSHLKEKDGTMKQYIPISNVNTASKEDITYNKQLYIDKTNNRKFQSAEIGTASGMEDGDYHKYSDAFKAIRDKYEYLEVVENADKETRYYWNKKETVSHEDYDLYRAKYFNKVEYMGPNIDPKTGEFEGAVSLKTGFFPKSEYVEIRDVARNGMDLRDPKYVKLSNPSSPVERAQSEFYKGWTNEMDTTLEKLPPDVQRSMNGKVGRIRSSFIEAMTKNGSGFYEAVSKKMRNFFTADVYTNQRIVDEKGQIAESVPIMYVGKLQSEKSVQNIKDKITKLNADKLSKKVSQKEYLAQKKDLTNWLRIEEGKVSSSELEGDLVNNLIAFRAMAENFEAMSNVEADIKAIQRVVEDRTYIKTDSTGQKLLKKIGGGSVLQQDKESLAARRVRKYMKMVFYADEEFNKTTMAMVAQRLQQLTSLKGIGFNVFGGVNNYVMGRINNAVEAAGNHHYTWKSSTRANMAFNKELVPGWLGKVGRNPGSYAEEKNGSKYEALVEKFRIVRKNQQDSGRVDPLSWAYIIQEGGEYNVQSKTGIAILMDKQLTNSITGETESIYDAYEFNPNTNQLKLKPGYTLSDEERHKQTNYIYEVNKKIHGNYAFGDRMVIQEHWIGSLAAQFHKWVYPSYKNRFKSRYMDQNLGELEGRYLTVWSLIKYIAQSEGAIYDRIKSGWANMDDMQIANMRKNMAELGFLMSSIAMYNIVALVGAGVPDEDEELKRFMNFLQYQQSRQAKELLTLVPIFGLQEQFQLAKSPIAVLGTAKDFGDVLLSALKLPIPPYDKNYYEKGVHKGDLKAWKELKDVIPALAMLNRWDSFETVKSFYIK